MKNLIGRALAIAAGFCFAASAAADPAYTARPLSPRLPPPPGEKLFSVLPPEQTGVTVSNVYDDPRMWGDRFRELT